jgi:hypothetical protein
LGKRSGFDALTAAALDEIRNFLRSQRLGLAQPRDGRLQRCQAPSRHAQQPPVVAKLVHAQVILVGRLAICVRQGRLRLGAASNRKHEEQASLVRAQNPVHGSTKIGGVGTGMVENDQALALVGPLEHGQAILDRHQGGPIAGVAGVWLGEDGEQAVTQVRRWDWYGWIQDGAV